MIVSLIFLGVLRFLQISIACNNSQLVREAEHLLQTAVVRIDSCSIHHFES